MKTRYKILYFLLGVSVIANIGLVCTSMNKPEGGKYAENTMYNVYEQNLNSLSARCYDLEQGLSKLGVCNQAEQSVRILTDIIDDSGAAVTSLSTLPLYPEYVAKLNRYLNQVSDYSKYMLFMSAGGSVPSEKCSDNINALHKSVTAVNKALGELAEKLKSSPMQWSELMANDITEFDMLDNIFSSTMESIQTESIDYPTLIYDGPFSDSVVNKKIDEKEDKNISKEQATDIFKKFIKAGSEYAVYDVSECSGTIDTWCVTLEKNGEYCYGSIAKKTGNVVSFINNGQCYEQKISKADAIKVAEEFLNANGYENMKPQYCQISNGNATINFVYSKDGTLIYPDMVKVRVDMCNSVVNGFEGMSYYANHAKTGSLNLNGSCSLESTQKLLAAALKVTSSCTAVIPTEGGGELLCYEFRCKMGNDTYVVYFDANSQKQVKIFKILSTENGDFVV